MQKMIIISIRLCTAAAITCMCVMYVRGKSFESFKILLLQFVTIIVHVINSLSTIFIATNRNQSNCKPESKPDDYYNT